MEEIFKDYPLNNKYKVSNLGKVIGPRGCALKPYVCPKGYASLKVGKNKVKVHQMVAETFLNHKRCGHKVIVDHIDNTPSNNRADNLQLITHRENLLKDKENKTSKYRGVSVDYSTGMFRSQVMLNRKVYYLGLYKTEDAAHIAYIDAFYEYELTK